MALDFNVIVIGWDSAQRYRQSTKPQKELIATSYLGRA